MIQLNATDAKKMFPNVKGDIWGADLWSGFAVLDMGPNSYGVMVKGEFVACSTCYSAAKRAGEVAANKALGLKTLQVVVRRGISVVGSGWTIVTDESAEEVLSRFNRTKGFILNHSIERFDVLEVRS
jgi:hypothetical protein